MGGIEALNQAFKAVKSRRHEPSPDTIRQVLAYAMSPLARAPLDPHGLLRD